MKIAWLITFGLLMPDAAAAGPRYQPYLAPPTVASGPEGVGCVWYRQRLDCSRYCYWEVNGRRYCRERERGAHAQGFIEEYFYAPPAMKLGVPRR